jgi:hypothetical protein
LFLFWEKLEGNIVEEEGRHLAKGQSAKNVEEEEEEKRLMMRRKWIGGKRQANLSIPLALFASSRVPHSSAPFVNPSKCRLDIQIPRFAFHHSPPSPRLGRSTGPTDGG